MPYIYMLVGGQVPAVHAQTNGCYVTLAHVSSFCGLYSSSQQPHYLYQTNPTQVLFYRHYLW